MSIASKKSKTVKLTNVTKRAVPKKVYDDRISDEVGNYEKHPFFVKKANDMKELLERVGLPEDFVNKRR